VPAATGPDPLLGVLLDGRYHLETLIARGGMAAVYVATDTRLDRTVAVKVMRPALAEDPAFVDRFAREARAAARLSSPDVVAVHDQGTDPSTRTAYLVMEHVAGRTLRDVIVDEGPQSPARALALLEPVLRALAAAHAAGLVHRDVKPENVLLGEDGRVKVADFGLARAIETSNVTATTGLLIGTVAYLAPEQVEHGRADTRTDVYAAGILLFELLTGSPPYTSESPMSVVFRHVLEDVPPPSSLVEGVPAALDELVVSATRRDPSARPVDAGAFLAELRAVRADLGPDSGDQGVVRRTQPTLVVPRGAVASSAPLAPQRDTRRRTVLWTVVVALLASAALAGGWYLGEGRYTDAPAVLGMPTAEAAEVLQAAGFTVDYLPEAFDEQVPPQHVLDQDPDPSRQVRKGGTITLQASKGQDRRAVPVVAGTTQEDATAALEEVGLQVGTITRDYDDAPSGTVVSSAPAAGEPLRPDAAVDLVVSRGQELLDVPDVTGQPREEAGAALEAAGFGNEVTEVFSETVGAGAVVAQDPSSGQAVRGAKIALQVSKGPELITVPDVEGDPRADAKRELEGLGLKVREFAIPGPGRVRSTDPGAGTKVRKGSTVTVYIF